MRQVLTVAVVVMIGACSAPQPSGDTAASSPRVAFPVSPTSAAASSTRQTGPILPLTTLGFACRLPAYHYEGPSVVDTFIDFPSGSTTAASSHGTFYDAAVSRWLPVFQNQVSPDGLQYAHTEGWTVNQPKATVVHVVDAATDRDIRTVSMPDTQPYFVLDYSSTGVYLGIGYDGRGPGVWKLDPSSGSVTKVSDGLYPPDAQWIAVVDPKDPQPYRSAMTGEAVQNRIDHRDSAGQTTTWFYRPGHALWWVAVADNSALLVQAGWSNPTSASMWGIEYWLVTGPNQARELAAYTSQESSPYVDLQNGFPRALADTHGIWIGGTQSLYLVTQGGSILRVYAGSAYPAGSCN